MLIAYNSKISILPENQLILGKNTANFWDSKIKILEFFGFRAKITQNNVIFELNFTLKSINFIQNSVMN